MRAPCCSARCPESLSMDSASPEIPAIPGSEISPPPLTAVERPPRVWKFWGTALWGFVVFAAMVIGQIGIVILLFLAAPKVVGGPGKFDLDQLTEIASNGLAISLSVMAGLPAVLLALWLAIRWTRIPFADYLALRWTSWGNAVIGAVGLVVLVEGWDLLSRAIGHEVTPGFMIEVMKSAREAGALWLMALAFCVAAPITEELFARGFLYRGWSESFLHVPGAIVLSSLVWTGMHLQYDQFFFGEVFCIGLWFGYIRYRSNSIWLTIVLHGLNNLGALAQTMYLAG
jgi:membrane protease YdiL (CAAX protease family)